MGISGERHTFSHIIKISDFYPLIIMIQGLIINEFQDIIFSCLDVTNLAYSNSHVNNIIHHNLTSSIFLIFETTNNCNETGNYIVVSYIVVHILQ